MPVAVLATALATANVTVPAAFATIAASSLATGALFWATGRFGLGRIVKYFPQPVILGFLAGTGWLLLSGGVAAAVGFTPSFGDFGVLSAPTLRRLVPAALLAVLLHVVVKRFKTSDGSLVVPRCIDRGVLRVDGGDGYRNEHRDRGGHLPRGASGVALRLPFPGMLNDVDWGDVVRVTPTILTVAVLCLLAMLMNSAALERALPRTPTGWRCRLAFARRTDGRNGT